MASTWVIDPAHSSVEFSAKHMMISTGKGRFAKFDVDVDFDEAAPEQSRVEARIDAASIDTKQPQRDAHLSSADFLDADNFPWIVFTSRRVESQGNGRYHLVGDLTIRDVAREVVLDTTFEGLAKDPMGNLHAGFTAETTINRTDFGLTWNMALETGGFLVGDTVKISIEIELIAQS
ncbi:MAG: YceI family protein [Chloroflexi bacterium]|nr:YceI family protein [Chloroflexota bacterium]